MNANIHVTCSGQGFPVVLFHGWGFDGRVWDPVLPMLTQHYQVYCVDLPGFGLSPFMGWEAFKASLLQQLPERFALIGWSLGGLVATHLTLDSPDRVTHVVQIASSPCFVEDGIWPGIPESTLLRFNERLLKDPAVLLREFMTLQLPGQAGEIYCARPQNVVFWRRYFLRGALFKSKGIVILRSRLKQRTTRKRARQKPHFVAARSIYTQTTIEGLQAGLNDLLTSDFRAKLCLISCPVLYLFGSRDSIVPIKTMKVMQDRYPQFQYLFFNKAAHAIFLSHTDDSVKAMVNFISTAP